MLDGQLVNIRLMRESDIEKYYELHENVKNRGPYYPTEPNTIQSISQLKKRIQEDGYWDPMSRFSVLLVTDKSGTLIGRVNLFPARHGYDGHEIGWITFETENRGKGYTTEAVQLVVKWMFGGLKINRIEAYIHPDNVASKRVAEKCGFTYEATLRGIWFQHGQYHDLMLYSILRSELSFAKPPQIIPP